MMIDNGNLACEGSAEPSRTLATLAKRGGIGKTPPVRQNGLTADGHLGGEEMTIAAIPTTYRGVNFRSRLEAKWAAFFDLGNRQWAYEAIDLEGYIPDFVLYGRRRNALVEVKPEALIDLDSAKLKRAAEWCAAHDWRLILLKEHLHRNVIRGRWWGIDTQQFYESEPAGLSQNYFREGDTVLPTLTCGKILIHQRLDVSPANWVDAKVAIRPEGGLRYLEFGIEDSTSASLDGEWADFNVAEECLAWWAKAGNTVQWSPATGNH